MSTDVVSSETISSGKRGRKPGVDRTKALDLLEFLLGHNLRDMYGENPWLLQNIRLVENPLLNKSPSRAIYAVNPITGDTVYDSGTVELSNKVINGKVSAQREAFIRAVSHFIAFKHFKSTTGLEYQAIVKRFIKGGEHYNQSSKPAHEEVSS